MVFRRRKLSDRVQTVLDEMLHLLLQESMSSPDVRPNLRHVQASRLENRILMSASPMVVAEAVSGEAGTALPDASLCSSEILSDEPESLSDEAIDTSSPSELTSSEFESTFSADDGSPQTADAPGPELIVIDYRVQDADTLLEELLNTDRDFRLLRLAADENGLSEITAKLEQIGNVSAVHLLTHGRPGEILLGSARLNADTLPQYAPELLAWQHSLTNEADLLLYACDVAGTVEGQDFVETLSRLTKADVAASSDSTGSQSLGGNWQFEYQTGLVESQVALSLSAQQNWSGLLATFVVTNTNDSGGGSLRQAILEANANPGLDTITFNIADSDSRHYYYQNDFLANSLTKMTATTLSDGDILDFDPDHPFGHHSWFRISIHPGSGPLTITDAVIIDGYSQPGSAQNSLAVGHNATLRIELTSTGGGGLEGLQFSGGASGSTVRGLAINGFGGDGIEVASGVNNVTIQGNFVGTDVTGIVDRGNGDKGVHLYSSGNLIGGPNPADRNLISGNGKSGILLRTNASLETNNTIEGNYIGVDATGLRALRNEGAGIEIEQQGNLQIRDNVISGNKTDGILFDSGGSTTNTVIRGNLIGVGADGTTPVGNLGAGIRIDNSVSSTTIGGIQTEERNTIAHNAADGVAVKSGSGTTIRGNSIYSNGGLGINLKNDGVTANDALDIDNGPNGLQNYPVINSAEVIGVNLIVSGTLSSSALLSGQIDVYWSAVGDPSEFGEAQNYVGSVAIDTDPLGMATFNHTFLGASVPFGAVITTTMTSSSGNTSEFSRNRTATGNNTPPVLDASASPVLDPVKENSGPPVGAVGTLVSSLAGFPGGEGLSNVTDPDPGAQLGIAITGTDTTWGVWWYSTNNGTTWTLLGSVSSSAARLLAADTDTRLYFQPTTDWNGTVTSGITFHAWDRTIGVVGELLTLPLSTVADQFSSVSYDNNSGTTLWSSPWVENDGNGGGASGGRIQIHNQKLEIRASRTGDFIDREVDLNSATSATLSFDLTNTLGNQDQIDLQISSDGGVSYSTIGVFSRNHGPSSAISLDISPFISSSTRLRFYVAGSNDGGQIRIDNLSISFDTAIANGTAFSSQSDTASIVVLPANVAPVIITNGGGPAAAISVPENTTYVTTVIATDADLPAQTLIYSISGGADAAKFTVDSSTGLLQFITPPDAESSTDGGGDNVYEVIVQVSDGTLTDSQTISVSVTDVNEFSVGAVSDVNVVQNAVTENAANGTMVGITARAMDPDASNNMVTYSLDDSAEGRFGIHAVSGVVTVADGTRLDRESAASHTISVRATGSDGSSSTQTFTISLLPVNDNSPVIITNGGGPAAAISVPENTTYVTTVIATDADLPAQTLIYSISGGADAARFTINSSTGALRFTSAPNFESPTDANRDNIYFVAVQASDGARTDLQLLTVTVIDVNESPTVTGRAFQTTTDQPLIVSTPGLLATARDPEGDVLHVVILQNPMNGTLVSQPDGTFRYTPASGFSGRDQFQFAVSDGLQTSQAAFVSIDVLNAPATVSVIPVPESSGPASSSNSDSTSGTTMVQSETQLTPVDTASSVNSATSPFTANAKPGNVVSGSNQGHTEPSDELISPEPGSDPMSSSWLTSSTNITSEPVSETSPSSLTNSVHRTETRDFTDRANAGVTQLPAEVRREALYLLLSQDGQVWQELDSFHDQLSESGQIDAMVVGSVGVVGTGLSVGYLIWIVRFGTILSGLLAQVPAWTMLDPLLVMDGQREDEDQESIQTIVDQRSSRAAEAPTASAKLTGNDDSTNHRDKSSEKC